MKKILFLLLIIALFSSCTNKQEVLEEPSIDERFGDSIVAVIDDSSLLIGKWKLDTVVVNEQKNAPDLSVNHNSYDYAQESIIYEFSPLHILTVTGEMSQIDCYKGHEQGAYSYILGTRIWASGSKDIGCSLLINDVLYLPDFHIIEGDIVILKIFLITDLGFHLYKLVKIE